MKILYNNNHKRYSSWDFHSNPYRFGWPRMFQARRPILSRFTWTLAISNVKEFCYLPEISYFRYFQSLLCHSWFLPRHLLYSGAIYGGFTGCWQCFCLLIYECDPSGLLNNAVISNCGFTHNVLVSKAPVIPVIQQTWLWLFKHLTAMFHPCRGEWGKLG